MTILKVILWIVTALTMLVPAKRALHMFQQNRYETGRFIKWMKESIRIQTSKSFIPLTLVIDAVFIPLFFKKAGLIIEIIILILLCIYLFHQEKNQKYIKPLVYTARVKRQIVVLSLLTIL